MRNLLNFLLKYNYWFLFIVLEVASFVLLFRFNRYQQSAFFTSANTVVGAVYEVSGGVSSYFHLKSVNEDLMDRNMVLEQQITNLEKALRRITKEDGEFIIILHLRVYFENAKFIPHIMASPPSNRRATNGQNR